MIKTVQAWRVAAAALTLAGALAACSDRTDDSQSREQPPGSTEQSWSGSGSVWVANEAEDSLTVLDASTNAVVTTLAGIKHPHNVQVGRDGSTVYATSAGAEMVVAIDASTYTVSAVAATGSHPGHVIEAPNGKVYVTDEGDGAVSVYRGSALTSVGRIEVGGSPHGLRPAAGGSVLVIANTGADRLDLIDPATDRVTGSVPVGTKPVQVAVTADGRYAYSGISEPPAVVKVAMATREVVGSAPVPAAPVQLYLTPDEKTVVSADQGSAARPGNTMSVIDTATMNVRGTVDTGSGSGPHGVVIDTSGARAWVTNTFDDTVSVVDVDHMSEVATIAVGKEPNGISYSSQPPAPPPVPGVTLSLPAAPTSPPGERNP